MEDKKKFELSDDALDNVAGGIDSPEYAGRRRLTCTNCGQTLRMELLRSADIDGLFARCPACGEYKWDV